MAKYYYEKRGLDKRWSEDPDNPQPYLQKKIINVAIDKVGTWFATSGTTVATLYPGHQAVNRGRYLKYTGDDYYYDNIGIQTTGYPVYGVGESGVYITGVSEGYYSIYSATIIEESPTRKASINGYWLVTKNERYIDIYEHLYGPKNLIEIIEAEDGTYPDNGQEGNFWYIKKGLVFPELTFKIEGAIKTSEYGWVKIDGQLKEIDRMWTKINGELKEI